MERENIEVNKNKDANAKTVNVQSHRGIYIKNDRVALLYSKKNNFYKFPGGIWEEKDLTLKESLIAKIKREAGLIVIPDSITKYTDFTIIEQKKNGDVSINKVDFFFVKCEDNTVHQELDDFEKKQDYTLEFVDPTKAWETNKEYISKLDKKDISFEKESNILHMIAGELDI